eukprot:8010523-Pyramimonas_sp.AAC.1
MGDFNFCALGEGRTHMGGEHTYHTHGLAKYFSRLFPGFAEVSQPTCSHRRTQIHDNVRSIQSVARLDRIYTNMYSASLIDLQANSLTLAGVCDLEWPSDHVLVCLSLSPFQASGAPRIASWVCRHLVLPRAIQRVLDM